MTQDTPARPREFWINCYEGHSVFVAHRTKERSESDRSNPCDEHIHVIERSAYDALAAQLTEANRRLAIAREFVEQMHEQGILLGIKSDEDDETIGLDPDEVAQRANVVLRKISDATGGE